MPSAVVPTVMPRSWACSGWSTRCGTSGCASVPGWPQASAGADGSPRKAGPSSKRHASLALEAGRIRAPDGRFKARTASVLLGLDLDLMPQDGSGERGLQGMGGEAKLTRYTAAARYRLPEQSFDTVGFAINRRIGPNLYYTGQALSAVDGRAGGYSMGLVGLGANSDAFAAGWAAGLEVLGGAAGGGGVNTQGGAVLQGVAYLTRDLPGDMRLKLGLGRVKSRKGELDSPLVDLSLNIPFSVPAKR